MAKLKEEGKKKVWWQSFRSHCSRIESLVLKQHLLLS